MTSFKSIPAALTTVSSEVPDSKVSNSSDILPTPHASKSSNLLRALLALDEKYATSGENTSSGVVNDVKLTVPKLISTQVARSMSSHLRAGSKPITVRLVNSFNLTSAANTALNSVQALSPIGASDFSSYAALYDLQRTKRMSIYWQLAASGLINGTVAYALAFDPSNIGVYSSISDVMTAEQMVGPGLLPGTTAVTNNSVPCSTSSTHPGFFKMDVDIKTKKYGLVNDSTASLAVGGSWVGTSDTTAVVGWFKPYVAAAGGALTTTVTCYVAYDVEFMTRT